MSLNKSDIIHIQAAREILDKELGALTTKEIAASVSLSETKLAKGFRHLYQVSVYQYHLHKRMEFARTRLEEGLLVKEVAAALGYADSKSFYHAFKKVFKLPPSKFK